MRGICNGDSGGPLVFTTDDGALTNYLIGVASKRGIVNSPFGCNNPVPGEYMRVNMYLDFIKVNMDGIQPETCHRKLSADSCIKCDKK